MASQILSNFCSIPAFYAKVPSIYSKIPDFYVDICLFGLYYADNILERVIVSRPRSVANDDTRVMGGRGGGGEG